jgi:hypothetical protein
MSPLDQFAQVPSVAAPEIQHGLSRLDSGEPEGREDVLASKLLRSEPPRRLEEKAVFVAQKVPFSR